MRTLSPNLVANLHSVVADTQHRRFYYRGCVIEEAYNYDGRHVWEWVNEDDRNVGGECNTQFEAFEAVNSWYEQST